jgi:hypothetical protein
VVVRINDLIVFEAECVLPPQVVDIADSASLMNERHRIYWGVIDRGLVNLEIQNKLAVPANVLITMPNLHDNLSGGDFINSYYLEPFSIRNEPLLLDGQRINDYPDPNSGRLIDYLLYNAYALTDSTGDMVNISESDSILVRVYPDSIYFYEVNGVLDRINIEIDPMHKSDLFDASRVQGNVFLDSLSLHLNLHNETDIPINLTMNISGHNDNNSMILAPIQMVLPPSSQGGELHRVLSINDPQPNIVDLMGILPSDITIETNAYVQGLGQISLDQQVWGDYEISSPLYLRLLDTLYIKSEMDSMR